MNTRFKIFASSNILQYMCEFLHVMMFVNVSKFPKSPKLTNIVFSLLGLENRSQLSTNLSDVVRYDYHENKKY